MTESPKFLRLKQVRDATGLGASTIYRMMQRGEFPKNFPIYGRKVSGWLESEVCAWMQSRLDSRDAKRRRAA